MASIDDLPADQQAVLRLLLGQGRAYDEIATTLKMAPAAVRDRAHDALIALGPADTPLGRERRAQVADWLLSQQSVADAESTEQMLRSSSSARAWVRSVSSELEPLAKGALPALPDGDDAATTPAATPAAAPADAKADTAPGSSPLLDEAPAAPRAESRGLQRPSSRRGGMLLLTGAAFLATLAVGFFLGRATKDDDSDEPASTQAAAGNIKVLGQTNLKPPSGASDQDALGIAQFVQRTGTGEGAGDKLLNVIAQGLPKAPEGSGYGVWLTKQGVEPVWLGYFQAVTTSGEVGAQSPLTVDPTGYTDVILTRQRGQNPKTPGTVYLEGPVNLTNATG